MKGFRENLVTHEQTEGQTNQYDFMRSLTKVGSQKFYIKHHDENF